MNTILLQPNDISKLTAISGNVELDKLTPYMWVAQNNEVKRILTNSLYEKILQDFENDDLTGVYLDIYNNYVLYFMVHFTAAHYLTTAPYYQGNGGVFKLAPEGTESITQNELTSLVSYHRNLGAGYEVDFKKWIKTNYQSVPEYDTTYLNKTSIKLNWIL